MLLCQDYFIRYGAQLFTSHGCFRSLNFAPTVSIGCNWQPSPANNTIGRMGNSEIVARTCSNILTGTIESSSMTMMIRQIPVVSWALLWQDRIMKCCMNGISMNIIWKFIFKVGGQKTCWSCYKDISSH